MALAGNLWLWPLFSHTETSGRLVPIVYTQGSGSRRQAALLRCLTKQRQRSFETGQRPAKGKEKQKRKLAWYCTGRRPLYTVSSVEVADKAEAAKGCVPSCRSAVFLRATPLESLLPWVLVTPLLTSDNQELAQSAVETVVNCGLLLAHLSSSPSPFQTRAH